MLYENACISLEMCRAELERAGAREDARLLHGLEVMSPSSAAVALDALHSIKSKTAAFRGSRDVAVRAIERTLIAD